MTERDSFPIRAMRQFRLYFLTGLLALAPVVITAYILWHLFFTVDSWLGDVLKIIPWPTLNGKPLPGLGFISVTIIILLAGVIARNIVGGQLLRAIEQHLLRVPMVRTIYNATKQLSQAVLGQQRSIFQRVVLVPFPTRGMYAVAFMTADAAPEVQRKAESDLVSVFLPTTPNPTSGYLLAVRRDDMIQLNMTVEEAVKLVISGGAIIPQDRLATLTGDDAGTTVVRVADASKSEREATVRADSSSPPDEGS